MRHLRSASCLQCRFIVVSFARPRDPHLSRLTNDHSPSLVGAREQLLMYQILYLEPTVVQTTVRHACASVLVLCEDALTSERRPVYPTAALVRARRTILGDRSCFRESPRKREMRREAGTRTELSERVREARRWLAKVVSEASIWSE